MKNIKSNAVKSLLVIALLCPIAFAEGDQGSGGFAGNADPVVCGVALEGDQGSGGFTRICEKEAGYIDSVIKSITAFFESVI